MTLDAAIFASLRLPLLLDLKRPEVRVDLIPDRLIVEPVI